MLTYLGWIQIPSHTDAALRVESSDVALISKLVGNIGTEDA
jgi:hypothetical protein